MKRDALFFDDTVIAVRFLGHLYGVFPPHHGCVQEAWSGRGISAVVAADEEAVRVSTRACNACQQPILNDGECVALTHLRVELSLAAVSAHVFQWSIERNRYEAQGADGVMLAVLWADMANTIYKCLQEHLEVKRAFDAREWEQMPNGKLRFIVLKKRT